MCFWKRRRRLDSPVGLIELNMRINLPWTSPSVPLATAPFKEFSLLSTPPREPRELSSELEAVSERSPIIEVVGANLVVPGSLLLHDIPGTLPEVSLLLISISIWTQKKNLKVFCRKKHLSKVIGCLWEVLCCWLLLVLVAAGRRINSFSRSIVFCGIAGWLLFFVAPLLLCAFIAVHLYGMRLSMPVATSLHL